MKRGKELDWDALAELTSSSLAPPKAAKPKAATVAAQAQVHTQSHAKTPKQTPLASRKPSSNKTLATALAELQRIRANSGREQGVPRVVNSQLRPLKKQ